MEVLPGPCVGDVQDHPLYGQKCHMGLRGRKIPSRSSLMSTFPCHQCTQPQFEQSRARGTRTALKALVCPRLAHCGAFCPGIMLQDLHRGSDCAVWWRGQGMTVSGNQTEDNICFSFSCNNHHLKSKRQFFFHFICFCHPLPSYFFIPALFFPCLSKEQGLYKHCLHHYSHRWEQWLLLS